MCWPNKSPNYPNICLGAVFGLGFIRNFLMGSWFWDLALFPGALSGVCVVSRSVYELCISRFSSAVLSFDDASDLELSVFLCRVLYLILGWCFTLDTDVKNKIPFIYFPPAMSISISRLATPWGDDGRVWNTNQGMVHISQTSLGTFQWGKQLFSLLFRFQESCTNSASMSEHYILYHFWAEICTAVLSPLALVLLKVGQNLAMGRAVDNFQMFSFIWQSLKFFLWWDFSWHISKLYCFLLYFFMAPPKRLRSRQVKIQGGRRCVEASGATCSAMTD